MGMSTMQNALLRDIVDADPTLKVVGEIAEADGLAWPDGADVVIVTVADDSLPPECCRMLAASPGMLVLGLADQGEHGFRWELLRTPLLELSSTTLRAAMHGPAGDG